MLGKKKDSAEKSAADSRNWYKDRYQSAVVWRNILAIITLMALAVSAAAVFAVQSLAPSKTVEPFVIQVDDKTGVARVTPPLTVAEASSDDKMNNFFIGQYVRAREGFTPSDFTYSQTVVRLMSSPQVFLEYVAGLRSETSPARVLSGVNGSRIARIESITYLKPAPQPVVQVRAIITERRAQDVRDSVYLITLDFDYNEIKGEGADADNIKYINPLGFLVTRYKSEQQTVPQP